MTIAKSITKTLDISVEDVRIDLTATIRSYDLTDTQFIFEIKSSNGMTANLTGSTAMYIVEYVHNSQTYAIQGDIDIIGTDTLSFNLPEGLKGYSGTVLIGIYVKLTDGTKIDIKDIAVRIEPSIMDKDIDFSAKTYFKDFETVKAEVVLEGEKVKTQIKAVATDVNGYANSQKQVINNFVTDVRTTGEKAKTDINAVLPSVQAEISEIKTEIENLPDIPDLFVAYADDLNGIGFSKTDSGKSYKGFSVKNSNLPSDYRWERNIDSLRASGRNLLKDTASDLYNKKITKDTTSNHFKKLYLVDNFNLNNLINKTVVLSFRLKNDGNSVALNNGGATYLDNRFGAHMELYWKNSSTGQTYGISPMTAMLYMKENNKRVYAVYTFTPPDNSYDTLYSLSFNMQIGYKPAQDNNSEWFLGEFKLEIGNQATEWSPAPEDAILSSNPINSILTTLSTENPSTTLGGTWKQLGTETKFDNTIYYWKRTN